MSRINTNVNSLIAQRVLASNNSAQNTSLERLSTGLRINRGKDDPAGLIASENLRAEKAGLTSAIANANEKEADVEKLFVAEARVDDGPVMKRFQPKDRGRAHPILKRTSHIVVAVAERE